MCCERETIFVFVYVGKLNTHRKLELKKIKNKNSVEPNERTVRGKSNCVSQLIFVYKMFLIIFGLFIREFLSILRTKEWKTLKSSD